MWVWVWVWLVRLVPSREKQDLPQPGSASLHLPGDRPVLLLLHVPCPHRRRQCPAAPAVFPLHPSLQSGPLPSSLQVSTAQGLGELWCSSLAVSSPSRWQLGLGVTGRHYLQPCRNRGPYVSPSPHRAWQAGQRHSVAGSKLLWPCSLHTDLCALWLVADPRPQLQPHGGMLGR